MKNDLIFVGFNSRVVALRRDTGEEVWRWKSRKGSGYVTLLLDGDRLIVSVDGYTYCLNPATGRELWFNELSGMGMGVVSLASVRGGSVDAIRQAAAQDESQNASQDAAMQQAQQQTTQSTPM